MNGVASCLVSLVDQTDVGARETTKVQRYAQYLITAWEEERVEGAIQQLRISVVWKFKVHSIELYACANAWPGKLKCED